MIEQDAIARIQIVGFSKVHRNPICIQLCRAIWAFRIERCLLTLRCRFGDSAKEFTGRCLIKARIAAHLSDRIEQSESPQSVDICCKFRHIERHLHVGLCRQIINFIWLNLFHQAIEIGRVNHIAIICVNILHQVLYTSRIKYTRTTNNAMHLISFFQQEFCKIGAILPRKPCNKCFFHLRPPFCTLQIHTNALFSYLFLA